MKLEPQSFYAAHRAAWRQWLATHHTTEQALWVLYDKGKDSKLTYEDIVEEALCFGWVDSKAGAVSGTQTKLYVARRNPKSAWAKTNKARIEKLTKAGRMQPAGLEAVRIAKESGAWDLLTKSDNLELPPELTALLQKHPSAKANFETFPPSSKKMILEWIYTAKRDETKQKRIEETVQLAQQNIRAHHARQ